MAEEDRIKWDKRWAAEKDLPRSMPVWVAELDVELPRAGRGLDVAAGAGRLAVGMARRGLEMTAVDISPVGLALAREAARDEGLKLQTMVRDLEHDGLPPGSYELICCFHYRQPGLFPAICEALAPGGAVLAEVATVRSLEKQPQRTSRWLAEPNELLRCCEGLEIVYYREGWFGDRALARVLARKP
jgi:2-polyprenyl-3-methyl-5-hydroxy-6-metoxy-1,4-benzoquinol methylase